MGKVTGFMEWDRVLPPRRPATERVGDWREFVAEFSDEQRTQQAGRCMDCGIPYCHQGCPLGNLIPDWNELVYRDRWQAAYQSLSTTNNFPEFTGRLCPAPCESACTLGINRDAVTIEQVEKEIIERAYREGWVRARPPRLRSGKRVAVVGSGPAGLAAAAQLNAAGHSVTVYEAADRMGGLLRYGIPDFKLEKTVIDRRLEVLSAEGVEFVTGAPVGESPTWRELHDRYDAVLIAIGSRRPRDLQVPGRELQGVHFAMDFLSRQNRLNANDEPGLPELDAHGKQVIVLGGGDTGSDCLGTSLRQGAAVVRQIELLPQPPDERALDNPWPQWPTVHRISSSQAEGGERDFAVLTKELIGEQGKLTALRAVRIDVQPKAGGGLQITERPETELTVPVDMLLLAMGFVGPQTDQLVEQLGVELDPRGNVATSAGFATNVDGVFCAGDANRGQSLIVWAISEGREAARMIDRYLRDSADDCLPTRGRHLHFGGR